MSVKAICKLGFVCMAVLYCGNYGVCAGNSDVVANVSQSHNVNNHSGDIVKKIATDSGISENNSDAIVKSDENSGEQVKAKEESKDVNFVNKASDNSDAQINDNQTEDKKECEANVSGLTNNNDASQDATKGPSEEKVQDASSKPDVVVVSEEVIANPADSSKNETVNPDAKTEKDNIASEVKEDAQAVSSSNDSSESKVVSASEDEKAVQVKEDNNTESNVKCDEKQDDVVAANVEPSNDALENEAEAKQDKQDIKSEASDQKIEGADTLNNEKPNENIGAVQTTVAA